MEPLAGSLAQLGGELQVMVGADGIDVTQVSGQMRQLGLNVHSLRIPTLEHQDGATVTQVMNAWGMALGINHPGADAQPMPQSNEIIIRINLR